MSKILVIEDNSYMQSLLCEFIEAFGYQTEVRIQETEVRSQNGLPA